MPRTYLLVALFLGACSQSAPTDIQPKVKPVMQLEDAGGVMLLADAAAPSSDLSADKLVALPDAGRPLSELDLKPSKTWPFYQWDKAQAFTFNLREPVPGAQLQVYSETQGWTPKVREGPVLDASQAKQSLSLIGKTQGAMIVSKCPFPRHGIVFYQEGVPVGSVSVCFSCGDILLWPSYSPDPNWKSTKSKRFGKLMKMYDRVYPKWEELFEKQLGLATDWKKL